MRVFQSWPRPGAFHNVVAWPQTLETYSAYRPDDLRPGILHIAHLQASKGAAHLRCMWHGLYRCAGAPAELVGSPLLHLQLAPGNGSAYVHLLCVSYRLALRGSPCLHVLCRQHDYQAHARSWDRALRLIARPSKVELCQ